MELVSEGRFAKTDCQFRRKVKEEQKMYGKTRNKARSQPSSNSDRNTMELRENEETGGFRVNEARSPAGPSVRGRASGEGHGLQP